MSEPSAHVPPDLQSRAFVPFEKEDVEQSVPARFEQQVRRYPDHLAIKTRHHALSYDGLNRAANRLARAILAGGSPREAAVALLLQHDAPFVVALLAVLKSGMAYVPLDAGAPPARLSQILEDSESGLILADETHLAVAESLAQDRRLVLNVDAVGAEFSDQDLDLRISPDTIANITYTSGSTGEPKGVVQNHRAALHAALRRTNGLRISAEDRLALLFPFSFSAARQVTFAALLNGATLLPVDVKEEGFVDLAEAFAREGITVLDWTPSGFRHFARSLAGGQRFPGLRLIAFSAEPVSAGDVTLFRQHFPAECRLVNMLASTETGPTLMYVVDRHAELTSSNIPVGYPVEDMEVTLLDDLGQPVGPGDAGQVAIKSRYFASGYWRKPELTAATLLPTPDGSAERIFRSGDIGRFRPDGCLEVLGRKDSMVKIRGYRVEPTEVELALLELPGIQDVAVVARPDRVGEQQLIAYVIPADGSLGADGLRRALRRRLPFYMLPSTIVLRSDLPRTSNGKLDRRALTDLDLAQQTPERSLEPARNVIEQRLVDLWEDLLGVRPIGVRDDFFELGGHSLLAARLFVRIEQVFGRQLPLSVLLEDGTIEHLAKLIGGGELPDLSSLVAIQPEGARLPFFCVHPLFGDVLVYEPLARRLGSDQPLYALRAVEPTALAADHGRSRTIEQLAAHYIEAIRTVQASGPFLIGGFSFGGVVAFEMACQLCAAGHEIGVLALVDSWLPSRDPSRPPPSMERTAKLIRQLGKLSQWSERDQEYALVHQRMLLQYRPRPFAGRMLFFRALQPSLSLLGPQEVEPQEIWAELATGGLDLRHVPGDHVGLLHEPHIGAVAAELKRSLEQATRVGAAR